MITLETIRIFAGGFLIGAGVAGIIIGYLLHRNPIYRIIQSRKESPSPYEMEQKIWKDYSERLGKEKDEP